MKGFGWVAALVALLLVSVGGPLTAQSWRGDLGINGGGSWYSPMLGGDQIDNTLGDVRFRTGWLVGAQGTFWATSRIGIRANGTYTDRGLKQGDIDLWNDVNLWSGTGDLMFRLTHPDATYHHGEWLPYIALGLGAKWIAPSGSGSFLVANPTLSNTTNGVPIDVATVVGAASPAFFLPSQHVLMGLAGLGTDVRLAPHVALRLEAGDRIYKPEVWAIAPGTTGFDFVTLNSDNGVGKTVHEVYGQLGVHYLMGLASPPVVAVAPAPAPPPPPPPPVVTTQNVDVCVVDPTAPGGLRTVTAQFNPSTNDTTVMVNGTSMPLSQSVPNVTVASGQTWYVQGQPMIIGTGRSQIAYVSFGSARNIGASDLAYVGTLNGMPVYANRADVATMTIPANPGDINTNPTLVTGLRNVQVLYVPLTPTGCDFQPVQLQQQVRKVRG
jgi:hypothetical protein